MFNEGTCSVIIVLYTNVVFRVKHIVRHVIEACKSGMLPTIKYQRRSDKITCIILL